MLQTSADHSGSVFGFILECRLAAVVGKCIDLQAAAVETGAVP
jgi:hypothetical protein